LVQRKVVSLIVEILQKLVKAKVIHNTLTLETQCVLEISYVFIYF